MNVNCTQCQTVFRVDPAKVPVEGVRARCSVCAGVFWVRRDLTERPVAPPPATPAPAAAPPPPPVTTPRPLSGPAMPPAPAFSRPASAPGPAAPPAPRPAYPPAPAFAPPATSPPSPAPAAAPRAPAAAPARAKRPTNPFLSQDPEARARRLARALVSDIVVYHPAKRRDGLRDGSLKLLFEEEIRKSWEEYVDQVGRELADATPFFTDALNEILADGQPVFP
jgi:predicted Zn finger-like uncharacterized protein